MITRKTDYAIRCVLHLAEAGKDVLMVNEIAKEQDIPKSFLAKILQKLAKAGIVESLRGVKGGFRLAKKPEDISLLDVVELMEGPVAMNVCAADKRKLEGDTAEQRKPKRSRQGCSPLPASCFGLGRWLRLSRECAIVQRASARFP